MSSEPSDSTASDFTAYLALTDAEQLVDDGRWTDAIERLADTRDYLQDPATRTLLALEEADIAIQARRPHDALGAARSAVDEEIASGGVASADSLLALGYALDDCGEQAEALTVYESARRLLAEADDQRGLAHVDMNIALALPGVDRRFERVEMLRDARRRMQELDDDTQLRACEHNLVSALRGAELYDEALEMAEVVLEKQRVAGSAREIADAVFHRANILISLERTEEARAGYIEAMESYRHVNLPTEVADCISALGSIARMDGLFDFAVAMHHEAIRVYQEGRLQIEESISRYQLAKTLLRAGHFEGAASEGLRATGVLGSDVDGRVVAATAMDRLGRQKEGDELRQQFANSLGAEMLAEEIVWVDRE